MLLYKIDEYEVIAHDVDTNSNYNKGIRLYKNKELISGWIEKDMATDVDILESAIQSIKQHEKRENATTLEEFLKL